MINTVNPELEVLLKFIQDSIGLNFGLEFRSPGGEQPIQHPQNQHFVMFVKPHEQEQTSVF